MIKERPVLRWHGGKWVIAPWIIQQFPAHTVYTEAYGGAASVLIRKQRARTEVYNDLDGEVVNLFRTLREPAAADRLKDLLRLTPFARSEFDLSYEATQDPVEAARRLVVRSFMGFGSNAHNPKLCTGFRANSSGSGRSPSRDWQNYPEALPWFVERLRGVVIECRPALEIIKQQDAPDTLHYVDPPYPYSTRTSSRPDYIFEMSDEEHVELAKVLRGAAGMVVLSGYRCDLYDKELFKDWTSLECRALADGGTERVEVLWFNAAAWRRRFDGELFRSA